MPKSRRDRVITLSQTRKKPGLEFKQTLVGKIRDSAAKYDFCYLFRVENNRNLYLKQLRDQWSAHGCFYLGKNRVMALALGRTEAEEVETGLHQMAKLLRNECGLLFTNRDKAAVSQFFEDYNEIDFARTGSVATETVVLEAGPLEQFAFSLEPQLRALGLPTALKKGVITLLGQYTVCAQGDVLTSEQARILKLLGEKQAQFRLNLMAAWSKMKGQVEYLVDKDTWMVDRPADAAANSAGEDEPIEEVDDE